MRLTHILRALSVACLLESALSTPLEHTKRQASIDDFIQNQVAVSINGILANIGPDGTKAPGASAGILIASPSRSDPDCKPSSLSTMVLVEI
jgi:glucoamylase